MLKNIAPLLSADLLYHLRAMGHGDEMVIVDGNFPAMSHARHHVALPGVSATRLLDAVLSVLPLDDFVETPAYRMSVVDHPEQVPEVCHEFSRLLRQHENRPFSLGQLERQAFYDRVKKAYLVVSTGERRLYGNILLVKGVIRAAGELD